jgi:hypothetical protein
MKADDRRKESIEYRFTIQGIKLSAKLGHIILPFDSNILNQVLQNLKYYPIEQPPKALASLEIVPAGLARREDLVVDFNNEKQVLGMSSNNYDKVINGFPELIMALNHAIQPIELKVIFYESLTSAIIKSAKNPLEVFSSKSNEFIKTLGFDKLFEGQVSPLGMRLCPSNKIVDHTDWFEFRIEPYLYQQSELYYISYVYRNHNLEEVKKALNNFLDLSESVIRTLESP